MRGRSAWRVCSGQKRSRPVRSSTLPEPGRPRDVSFKQLNCHKYTQRDGRPISPKVYLHEKGVMCEKAIFLFLRKKKNFYYRGLSKRGWLPAHGPRTAEPTGTKVRTRQPAGSPRDRLLRPWGRRGHQFRPCLHLPPVAQANPYAPHYVLGASDSKLSSGWGQLLPHG